MSSYYPSSYLISFYSYIFLFLYLSILISLTFYIGCLSFYLYGGYPSRFLPICIWAVCLTYYMDCLSFLLYMYCLSSYSYGGYPSYLLSICAVFLSIRTGAISSTYFLHVLIFLSIRTGAIPPTYFLYVLSFFLFVRGLSLLLTFYMYCLSLYSYGGYLFHLFSTWAVHSVYVATVEFILGYILEMKSLT
jgi:hypothetical protein